MGDSLDPGGGDVGDVAHAPVEKVTNFLRSVYLSSKYPYFLWYSIAGVWCLWFWKILKNTRLPWMPLLPTRGPLSLSGSSLEMLLAGQYFPIVCHPYWSNITMSSGVSSLLVERTGSREDDSAGGEVGEEKEPVAFTITTTVTYTQVLVICYAFFQ